MPKKALPEINTKLIEQTSPKFDRAEEPYTVHKMNRHPDSKLASPQKEEYHFEDWTVKTVKSCILGSKCENPGQCSKSPKNLCNLCNRENGYRGNLHKHCKGNDGAGPEEKEIFTKKEYSYPLRVVSHRRYESELKLPSLPDMVFANNYLSIEHVSGGKLYFNTLDALKAIGSVPKHIEVAHAKVWQEARLDCEFAKRIVKDYDWTYSTSYSGTIEGLEVVPTDERIDLEKLKVQEEIKFFQEVYLYEDELDDNGSTKCTIKVRIMPSGFFIVFRHYLRVDHVIIRVNDTRLYHPLGSVGILREQSVREIPMSELQVDPATYKNPDLVWQFLNLIEEKVDKIVPRQ